MQLRFGWSLFLSLSVLINANAFGNHVGTINLDPDLDENPSPVENGSAGPKFIDVGDIKGRGIAGSESTESNSTAGEIPAGTMQRSVPQTTAKVSAAKQLSGRTRSRVTKSKIAVPYNAPGRGGSANASSGGGDTLGTSVSSGTKTNTTSVAPINSTQPMIDIVSQNFVDAKSASAGTPTPTSSASSPNPYSSLGAMASANGKGGGGDSTKGPDPSKLFGGGGNANYTTPQATPATISPVTAATPVAPSGGGGTGAAAAAAQPVAAKQPQQQANQPSVTIRIDDKNADGAAGSQLTASEVVRLLAAWKNGTVTEQEKLLILQNSSLTIAGSQDLKLDMATLNPSPTPSAKNK